ncbi:prepilin-type N-terminal cleavage/methylation domain-containing protein [Phycisphaeraceae bacterium D3-23]
MTHALRPHRRTPARFRGQGFTIIELLVAVSVLALMLFLINTLFFQTTEAVSTGVRTSTVLANARATNDRIALDASAMLGPNAANPVPQGGGYIVIIDRRIQSQVLRQDRTESLETFEVDQLVFMASANAANSRVTRFRGLAPRDASQFGSDFSSQFALVRYGHGRRVQRNGFDIVGWTELGETPASGEQNSDRLANDWILARQAVLFAPTDRFSNPIDTANDYYAINPGVLADIENDPLGRAMVAGFCDVTNIPPSGPMTNPTPGFIDVALDPVGSGLTPMQIQNNYLALTHFDSRLRVNPIPDATDFAAPQVGQLSGVFAPNCSDFSVQFAADANNDGEIDRVGPGGLNDGSVLNGDPIFWYDQDSIAFLGADPWATADWTGTTVPSPIVDLTGSNHGDVAFIFRYEDDQPYTETAPGVGDPDNSKWPYMIRIRYRLHDSPGKLEGNASFRLIDGIDNDLDGLIDEGTDGIDNNADGGVDEEAEQDEAQVSGRYFEQIIRVPRP